MRPSCADGTGPIRPGHPFSFGESVRSSHRRGAPVGRFGSVSEISVGRCDNERRPDRGAERRRSGIGCGQKRCLRRLHTHRCRSAGKSQRNWVLKSDRIRKRGRSAIVNPPVFCYNSGHRMVGCKSILLNDLRVFGSNSPPHQFRILKWKECRLPGSGTLFSTRARITCPIRSFQVVHRRAYR